MILIKYLTLQSFTMKSQMVLYQNQLEIHWDLTLILRVVIYSQHLKQSKMSMIWSWVMMSILLAIINGFTFLFREWLLTNSILSMLSILLKTIHCSTMAWLLSSIRWLRTKGSLEMTGDGGGRARRFLIRRAVSIDRIQGDTIISLSLNYRLYFRMIKYTLLTLFLTILKNWINIF